MHNINRFVKLETYFKYFIPSNTKAFRHFEEFALNGPENNPLTVGDIC